LEILFSNGCSYSYKLFNIINEEIIYYAIIIFLIFEIPFYVILYYHVFKSKINIYLLLIQPIIISVIIIPFIIVTVAKTFNLLENGTLTDGDNNGEGLLCLLIVLTEIVRNIVRIIACCIAKLLSRFRG